MVKKEPYKDWIVRSYGSHKDIPTGNADGELTELIRCKDCKYCSIDRYADGNVPNYMCIEMDCGVEADGFCAWAERKDNGSVD